MGSNVPKQYSKWQKNNMNLWRYSFPEKWNYFLAAFIIFLSSKEQLLRHGAKSIFECVLISSKFRSSHAEVFLRKGVLKICSKFTGEHPCRSAISIKLRCNCIIITLPHECSPVNLLHISRRPFLRTPPGACSGTFFKRNFIIL